MRKGTIHEIFELSERSFIIFFSHLFRIDSRAEFRARVEIDRNWPELTLEKKKKSGSDLNLVLSVFFIKFVLKVKIYQNFLKNSSMTTDWLTDWGIFESVWSSSKTGLGTGSGAKSNSFKQKSSFFLKNRIRYVLPLFLNQFARRRGVTLRQNFANQSLKFADWHTVAWVIVFPV